MKKIISLFQRNHGGDELVRNEIVPGAEWVVAGEGVATRKWDGTCCLIHNGQFYKRYEINPRKNHPVPTGFIQAQEPDPITGKTVGWIPVGEGTNDQWHREGFDASLPNGTYELCGPKVQGNVEHLTVHRLIPHGADVIDDAPREFESLQSWFIGKDIEGIVWHHPDGRMVKMKKKDFGLTRTPHTSE